MTERTSAQRPRGRLLIISGPSGAGKGTLVDRLVERVPEAWVSVSATTRPPRPGEVDGVDYRFVSPEEFDRLVKAGEFLEWAEVHGNRYGTLRSDVEKKIAEGRLVVLEIDPQGAQQVRRLVDDAVCVFVVAPSFEELERRIRKRGAESDEEIAARLKTAERELALVGTYDYVVQNDDVARAADELVGIAESLLGRRS
ncbi:guanylate kinase [Coriobacteriia bacterium Es71-Z0120]|uniref:guanylate kinase n=1 Tax=Parvivirga hydrogeniphila TaxID=2939460 RepID=UPI002260FFB0|nr:guanylate kinase [Parvivirga hydrogeniphila]MCL4079695.1 guanylate kinase [Parvivirga hydrogeniphila]